MRLFSRISPAVLLIVLLLLAACTPAAEPAATESAAPTAEAPVAEAPAAEAAATQAPAPETPAGAIRFALVPSQSEARFIINEDLMGRPTTVVGTNSSVSGGVTVVPGDPAGVTFEPIVIDANTFVTDNNRRNGAIQRFILQSSSYATITFTPTAVEGVPAAVAAGDTLELQVTGDLTIREVTRSETFAVTVQVVSENELHVSGSTQVLRDNYQLTIPSVPSVANVTNEVQLEFDFVATAQE